MHSLEHLLHEQLKDLYSAETQLVKALPKMARGASSDELRSAIEAHLRETEGQVQRLEQVAEHMEIALRGKKCKGMEGLIEEGAEILKEDGNESVLDAAIIAAAQKVEHYEISAYGSARALAERLGMSEVVELLQATLDEESATDEKLTSISESVILPDSPLSEDEGEAEEEDEPVTKARGGSRSRTTTAGRKSR